MGYGYFGGWPAYVSVAERKRNAQKKLDKFAKQGVKCQPVQIEGHGIARTFWGKAWCANLEAYSDYANRLPRGRSYVRNGSVLDLSVAQGKVQAQVMGSDLYQVSIDITALEKLRWEAVLQQCAGQIGSLIELLQGKLSNAVMRVVTGKADGLFPAPREIRFVCSCPDSASMCKHIAASLYGVGARLDHDPALLFRLRNVDPQALIAEAARAPIKSSGPVAPAHAKLGGQDLSALFGIDLGESDTAPETPAVATKKSAPADPVARTHEAARSSELSEPSGKQPAKQAKTIHIAELTALGVTPSVRQRWITQGVLAKTDTRGVYRNTAKLRRVLEPLRTKARLASPSSPRARKA